MRDYIIINGVNSLSIKGLAITKLPSIYKPIMRTEIEEIDGRNGDIITELGYGAYNKELTIGLFGDYDIDEIIAFFNQKGTIIFSNENDKVYNFDIVDQIEFEKLIKFRSATINIHCQPFKYPLSETPIEVEYEYVTGEGENITLNDTDISSLELDLKGNTSQTTYSGKNLLPNNGNTETKNGITFTKNEDNTITLNGTATADTYKNMWYSETNNLINDTSQVYTMSIGVSNTNLGVGIYERINNNWSAIKYVYAETSTYTPSGNQTGQLFRVIVKNGAVLNNVIVKPMLVKGTTVGEYEPYVGGTASPNPSYPQPINVVSGDNEIEICGKNLFDKEQETINTIINSAGTLTSNNDYNSSDFINIKSSTSIVLSTNTTSAILEIVEYDKNKSLINRGVKTNSNFYTLTTNVNTKYVRISYQNTSTQTQLEYGSSSTTYEPYIGNTYNIVLSGLGKNKFNIDSIIRGYELISTSGVIQANPSWWVSDYIPIEPNQTYTSSNISSVNKAWYDKDKTFISRTTTATATSPEGAKYMRVNGMLASLGSNPQAQIEEGSSATTFEAYIGIELCSSQDGTKRDYFLHDKTLDKWYWHREIGKVVLNGSETIDIYNQNTSRTNFQVINILSGVESYTTPDIMPKLLSNRFIPNTQGATWVVGNMSRRNVEGVNEYLYLTYEPDTTVEAFKTWLGTNNVTVYYVYATPTNTEITYQPLIDQLNLLEQAMSKDGQTNISQVNNDLQFIISASALKKGSNEAIINNDGNIYSKPLIDLEGTGLVTIYLNNTQMFQVDLIELNNITIDTELLEAYSDTQLANRKVVGDYSKFKLQVGTSQLKFGGALTKATITRYKRWL